MTNTLLLNADYQPLKVIPWQQAITLLLDETADMVVEYAGQVIRSAYTSFPRPAVVRLRRFVKPNGRLRFNRQNLLARDGYTCCYCGARPRTASGRPSIEELTLDHVIPRAQSRNGFVHTKDGRTLGVTCWENVVTACSSCNYRKADRTPEQAGMKLLRQPRLPSTLDVLRMSVTKIHIPTEWQDYLPEDSGWRTYWTAELE